MALWNIKSGMPAKMVLGTEEALDEVEQMSAYIVFGMFDGNEWDWDHWEWKPRD